MSFEGYSQDGNRALTEARSHSRPDVVPRGATMARAKEVAINIRRRKTPKKPPKQKAYAVTMRKLGPIRSNNYIWWRERETG